MLVRVLTLHFDPVSGSFDDGPLREFLKDKDVLSIRDHFFMKHEVPYLTVLVTYHMHQVTPTPAQQASPPQKEAAWRTLVAEVDVPLFNTLRDWRSERSKREGVPPYVICTNRQFAAMLKTRPQSLSTLAAIEGFGKGKLDKYGQELLALLAQAPAVPQPTPAASPTPQEHQDGCVHP
jgi:ATP-dependent DNA helicase RecQ